MGDGKLVYRHRLFTRLWHWLNAIAVICMVMSGLMISNVHPHLYWGEYGANFDKPWFNPPHFPGWITIPSNYSLARGRNWHLFFAWIFAFGLLAYIIVGLINRHIQRDVALTKAEVAPRHLWQDIKDHAPPALRRMATSRWRIIRCRRSLMAATLFVLFPLIILTGLALSPGFDAVTSPHRVVRRTRHRAAAAFSGDERDRSSS